METVLSQGYNEPFWLLVTLGIVKGEHYSFNAPKNADGYDLIFIGKPTDNKGFGGASL